MQLYSEAMRRDPFPVYEQLRRQSPLISDPQGMVWMLLDYESVKRVLTDHETFSSDVAPPTGKPLEWLTFVDPPVHTKLRKIFTRAFMPKSLASLEPRIREISRGLLNRQLAQGEMDIVASYSGPFPSMVIAELIGIPAQDQPTFLTWNEILLDLSGTILDQQRNYQQLSRYAQIQDKVSAYLQAQIAHRRRHPADDMFTRLVEAEVDGEKLSDSEILGFVQLLFSAATETATHLIANAVLTFLEYPDQLALLKAQPELVPAAVEEMLRFRSPIQTLIRRTKQAVELHGRTIPAGKYVFAVLGAANRDPSVFKDPHRFDIRRDPNPHLAFGYGAHYCMGLHLGRLEARVALPDLLEGLQNLQLTSPEPWEPQKSQHVLGPARLRVRFTPRGPLPV